MHTKSDLVNDTLNGVLHFSPFRNLAKLDVGPDIRIVIRQDWDKSKVALISGGGSGHEPAHVGFVGKGMLTAAVCGDIFASPSVDAVLSAIINLTGEAGCLLIVKNYTGDRLNFGLAAEKARKLGYWVDMVIVKDDISLPNNPQPRGIAGTVLIHKVAGYAAEQGRSLEEVTQLANQAIASVASLGVAFSSCHIPGENYSERVKSGCCELGMGIHGEPGTETLHTQNSREIVSLLADKLCNRLDKHSKVVLLVNNLGGFSALEMSLLVKEVLQSSLADHIKFIVGPATVVSALDMKGFSLSILPLTEEFERALLSPVETFGWPVVVEPCQPVLIKVEKKLPLHYFAPSENAIVSKTVSIICETLIDLEHELNVLDAQVGDGDTGFSFAVGARKIQQTLQASELPLNHMEHLMTIIGEHLAVVVGGSSGVLMSILFTATGKKLSEGKALAQAFLYGLTRVQHYGRANVGDRTMIDALFPAFSLLANGGSLRAVAEAAREGADSTMQMQVAKAGRSSYLNSDTLKGIKDPGAYAVEKVFEQLAIRLA